MRWDPSQCNPGHGHNLLSRLLQTGGWITHGRYYCKQERMGLRVCRVHYSLDHKRRLRAPDYDKREFDHPLVPVRDPVLLLREDVQKVVEEQLSPQALGEFMRHLVRERRTEDQYTTYDRPYDQVHQIINHSTTMSFGC